MLDDLDDEDSSEFGIPPILTIEVEEAPFHPQDDVFRVFVGVSFVMTKLCSRELDGSFTRWEFRIDSLSTVERIEVIGEGMTSVVYRARHLPSGREIALKVFTEESAIRDKTSSSTTRLLSGLSSQPNHKTHLVEIYGVLDRPETDQEKEQEVLCLALEYMPGRSLKDLYQLHPISEPILALILFQILSSLEFLRFQVHTHHGNLKPTNVLMNDNGVFKLSDVRIDQSYLDNQSTSLEYMAPERVNDRRFGFEADIWSLGIMIVEVMSQNYPLVELESGQPLRNLDEIREFFHSGNVPSFDTDEANSPGLRDFVDCCLQVDPRDRATVRELLEHGWLRSYLFSRSGRLLYRDFVKLALNG